MSDDPRPELNERVAQLLAHRATHAAEHAPLEGRIHGYCIVCGVPWPCEYAGQPPPKAAGPVPAPPEREDEPCQCGPKSAPLALGAKCRRCHRWTVVVVEPGTSAAVQQEGSRHEEEEEATQSQERLDVSALRSDQRTDGGDVSKVSDAESGMVATPDAARLHNMVLRDIEGVPVAMNNPVKRMAFERIACLRPAFDALDARIDSLQQARDEAQRARDETRRELDLLHRTTGDLSEQLVQAEAERDATLRAVEMLTATVTELRCARVGDSEIIGREMCRAEQAEARLVSLRAAIESLRQRYTHEDGGYVTSSSIIAEQLTALLALPPAQETP